MAKNFSNATIPYAGSTPNTAIRTWAQFIEDTLVTIGGWIVTTDTGQTLPSALVGSGTPNTKVGYRIYRMNDALQATSPVFIRIDFGCGSSSNPGFWVTIGTGSNGAGTITGILWNGGAATAPNVATGNSSVSPLNSYGSADPGRCAFGLCVSISTVFGFVFTIERTKSALGADTTDGLLLLYTNSQSSPCPVDTARYIICAGGAQPNPEIGLSYILTQQNPTQTFTPGDIGVGVPIHFLGIAQQPGTNMLITNSSDVSPQGVVRVVLYNQVRTYVQLDSGMIARKAFAGVANNDTSSRILLRWD